MSDRTTSHSGVTHGGPAGGGAVVPAGDGGRLPERFENPGFAPHPPRLADEDPAAARRATRTVAVLFGLSVLGTVGFIVAYALVPPGDTVASVRTSTFLLGGALFLALFGIGAAAVHWAKTLMSDRDARRRLAEVVLAA